MDYTFTIYSVFLLSTSIISFLVAFLAWQRRSARGAKELSVLMIGAGIWAFLVMFETAASTIEGKFFWSGIEYIGAVSTPVLYLIFVLRFTSKDKFISLKNILLLFIIPVITLSLALTNDKHHLIWTGSSAISEKTNLMEYYHGIGFWIGQVAYNYLMFLLASFYLLGYVKNNVMVFRTQGVIVFIAGLCPWIASLFYLSGNSFLHGLNITPASIILSGTLFVLAISYSRILNIVPVARKMLVERMPDGILVLDNQDRVQDINKAAKSFLGITKKNIIGFSAKSVKASSTQLLNAVLSPVSVEEIEIQNKSVNKSFRIHKQPIKKLAGSRLIIIYDITNSKQAEKKLEESLEREKNQADIVRNSPIAIAFGYPDGRLTNCNKSFTALCGYSQDELMNIDWNTTLTPPKWAEIEDEELKKLSPENNSVTYRKEYIHKDGTIIPIELVVTAKYDDNNNLLHFIGFISDITKREKAKIELIEAKEKAEESEEVIRQIFENSSIVHYSHDLNNVFHYTSPQIKSILGYTQEEIKISWTALISDNPINKTAFESTEKAIKTGEKQAIYQLELIHKNGNKVLVEVHEAPVVKNGKTVSIIGSFTDITERKKSEEAIKQKEKTLRSLLENPVGYIIYRTRLNPSTGEIEVMQVSPSFARTLGMPEEYKNNFQSWFTHVHPEDLPIILKANEEGMKPPFKLNVELRYNHPVEGLKWFEIRSTGIPFEANPELIEYANGIVLDITERKQLEVDLIKAKDKAEESDRLKSAFLANMSHEIRTPMNGILGFSNLLKEPKLSGEQQNKYISIIEKSGERMLNIINDIIDISKIESGLMTLDISESDINEQLEYIYTFFRPEVEAKGMKITLKNTLTSEEAIINTDREKVFAILTNLVKNAIKYSYKGLIEIGADKKGDFLEFFVKDTGIGIPKEKHNSIFERFIQADVEDKMARQGAGLGLTITKAYVEMLGGRIWVESQKQNYFNNEIGGSTFYFTIPYNSSYKQDNSDESKVDISLDFLKKRLKTLIVEDDEASLLLIELMLENINKKIITAKTGTEAIDAYKNNLDTDLILLDIQLPGINGYEVSREIRKINKDVIIIAQTAYGLSGEKEKAINAGCNDYISKPIKQDELFLLIQKHFN